MPRAQDAFVLGETVPQLGKALSVAISRALVQRVAKAGFRHGSRVHGNGWKGWRAKFMCILARDELGLDLDSWTQATNVPRILASIHWRSMAQLAWPSLILSYDP